MPIRSLYFSGQTLSSNPSYIIFQISYDHSLVHRLSQTLTTRICKRMTVVFPLCAQVDSPLPSCYHSTNSVPPLLAETATDVLVVVLVLCSLATFFPLCTHSRLFSSALDGSKSRIMIPFLQPASLPLKSLKEQEKLEKEK